MNAKLKMAGLLGAAVMAIPGAGLITNAVAADGTSSSATTEQEVPPFEPTQDNGQQEQQPDQPRPDREDCPEKDGQGDSSSGESGSSGTSL